MLLLLPGTFWLTRQLVQLQSKGCWRRIWTSSRWLKELTITVSSADAAKKPMPSSLTAVNPSWLLTIPQGNHKGRESQVLEKKWEVAWKRHHWRTEKGRDVCLFCPAHRVLPTLGSKSNYLTFNLTPCLTWCCNPRLLVRSTVHFMRKTTCNQKLCCRKNQILWKHIKNCLAMLLVVCIHWDLWHCHWTQRKKHISRSMNFHLHRINIQTRKKVFRRYVVI